LWRNSNCDQSNEARKNTWAFRITEMINAIAPIGMNVMIDLHKRVLDGKGLPQNKRPS